MKERTLSDSDDEVSWSSSDGEYHQTFNTSQTILRNRKRKNKSAKNLSSLDVTIFPAAPHSSQKGDEDKITLALVSSLKSNPTSPVLKPLNSVVMNPRKTQTDAFYDKNRSQRSENNGKQSPELELCNENMNNPSSPILKSKFPKHRKDSINRISYKTDTSAACQNKALISADLTLNSEKQTKRPSSPVLKLSDSVAKMMPSPNRRVPDLDDNTFEQIESETPPIAETNNKCYISSPVLCSKNTSFSLKRQRKKLRMSSGETEYDNSTVEETKHDRLSPILPVKRTLPDFVSPPPEAISKKIKSYFDSHFSSQSTSQVSINDSTSQSQIPSSQIDIAQIGTLKTPSSQIDFVESSSAPSQESSCKIISISSENSESKPSISGESSSKVSAPIKTESEERTDKKRRRHKKGGLASRLEALLKKQKNQLSLWQHEMYLASNSNFTVPSSSPYRVFGIKRINHEYGNHLIDAVDLISEQDYLLLLRLNFQCNILATEKSILKLYEPYEVIEMNTQRVIVNACKFECFNIKDENNER